MIIAVDEQHSRSTLVASSEVEGTTAADNWQNILVKGSSSIRTATRSGRQDHRR